MDNREGELYISGLDGPNISLPFFKETRGRHNHPPCLKTPFSMLQFCDVFFIFYNGLINTHPTPGMRRREETLEGQRRREETLEGQRRRAEALEGQWRHYLPRSMQGFCI